MRLPSVHIWSTHAGPFSATIGLEPGITRLYRNELSPAFNTTVGYDISEDVSTEPTESFPVTREASTGC